MILQIDWMPKGKIIIFSCIWLCRQAKTRFILESVRSISTTVRYIIVSNVINRHGVCNDLDRRNYSFGRCATTRVGRQPRAYLLTISFPFFFFTIDLPLSSGSKCSPRLLPHLTIYKFIFVCFSVALRSRVLGRYFFFGLTYGIHWSVRTSPLRMIATFFI